MSILDPGPCQNWPPLCADFPDEPTPDQQEWIDQSIQAATEALWNRTKRRFGLCSVKLRPCRRTCWPNGQWATWLPTWGGPAGWSWPFPALIGGTWVNLACRACGDNCSCSSISEVRLPYPVAEIQEVKVDGIILDPTAYRVDDYRFLIRLDGLDWPECNDLNFDDNQAGTWSVTALYGEMVPTLGSLAVGQLASQIYKSCAGDSSCQLPGTTVRQVTRQGVTKVFFDADSAFKNGKIGLYYPDLFIETYNPQKTGTTSIFNIDGPRGRRVGT